MERTEGANILSLTPSKVRDYQACPQQYKLKFVPHQLGDTASPSLSFGNSIHSALEEIHTSLIPSKQMFDCRQILRHHWKEKDYCDARESELYFERGLKALSRYVEVMARSVDQIFGTELYLSRVVRLDSARVRLGCKVDRLELHPDGVLEGLDYKTNAGGQVPTPEFLAGDLATFIYYILIRLAYPELPRVIISQLNVLTLAKVEVSYNSKRITANKQALVKLVQAIRAGEFDPRPGTVCSWCRVRDYCPAFGPDSDLDSLV